MNYCMKITLSEKRNAADLSSDIPPWLRFSAKQRFRRGNKLNEVDHY